jgi:restriction system protein
MQIPSLVRDAVARLPLIGRAPSPQRDVTAWRLRPAGGDDLVERMIDRSVVAIGAGEVGDLTQVPDPDTLKTALARSRPERSATGTARAAGAWTAFRCGIDTGDLVIVVRHGGRVAVAEVTGDYEYRRSSRDARLRHVRPVRWLTTDLAADLLPDDVQRSLRAPGTLGRVTPPAAAARVRAAA